MQRLGSELWQHHVAAAARGTEDPVKGAAVARGEQQAAVAVCHVSACSANCGVTFQLQHSETDQDGDFTDIAGAAQTLTAANGVATIDVRFAKKYIRAVLTPDIAGGGSVTAGVILGLYGGGKVPAAMTPAAVVL